MEKFIISSAVRFSRLTFAAALTCVISFVGCSERRPAVVERPVFEVWNSRILEVEKIEFTDTSTVIWFKAFFTPREYIRIDAGSYIRESGTDEKLFATGSFGVHLGEDFYMPENGETLFKVFFPALRKDITRIDFIESDCENCFKIWGIRLLKSDKITFEPPSTVKIDKDFPAPVYSNEPARLSGRVIGYHKEIMNELVIYNRNLLTSEEYEIKIPISPDGTFNGDAYIDFPRIVQTSIGSMMLTPGKETKVVYDMIKKNRIESRLRTDAIPDDRRCVYIDGSPLNFEDVEAINKSIRITYRELFEDVVEMKPEQYKKYMLALLKEKTDTIIQKKISLNAKFLAEHSVKLAIFRLLTDYEGFITAAHFNVNRNNPKPTKLKLDKPSKSYYSFLKELMDDRLVFALNYPVIIDEIPSWEVFASTAGSNKSVKQRFAAFKSIAAPALGKSEGLLLDLILAQMYSEQLGELKFFTDAEKAEIKTAFSRHPEYADALFAANDKFLQLVASGKGLINDVPDVPDAKLFDAILSKYKGKSVLIDFWATWCAPCMLAMETIKPLKEELKDRDVVFVYLTGPSSPTGTWYQKIPDIHGEHYRVNDSQWNTFSRQFEIEGIPTYLVYDKNGKQLEKFVGFPGNEAIKELLTK